MERSVQRRFWCQRISFGFWTDGVSIIHAKWAIHFCDWKLENVRILFQRIKIFSIPIDGYSFRNDKLAKSRVATRSMYLQTTTRYVSPAALEKLKRETGMKPSAFATRSCYWIIGGVCRGKTASTKQLLIIVNGDAAAKSLRGNTATLVETIKEITTRHSRSSASRIYIAVRGTNYSYGFPFPGSDAAFLIVLIDRVSHEWFKI